MNFKSTKEVLDKEGIWTFENIESSILESINNDESVVEILKFVRDSHLKTMKVLNKEPVKTIEDLNILEGLTLSRYVRSNYAFVKNLNIYLDSKVQENKNWVFENQKTLLELRYKTKSLFDLSLDKASLRKIPFIITEKLNEYDKLNRKNNFIGYDDLAQIQTWCRIIYDYLKENIDEILIEKKENSSDNRVDWSKTKDVGIVTHYNEKPFTGTAYSLHKNGKIEEECTMLNGLKHGICKYYNEEGEITDKIFYKNDEEKSRIIYTPSSEIHSVKLKDSQIQYRKYEDNTTTVYSPKKTKDEEFEIMFQESNEVISKTKMDSDSGSFLIFTNFNLFDEGIKYLIKEDLNEDWIHTSKLDKKGNNDSDNVYLDNKLFTGTGYFLHLNGRLCQAIKFKNGKQHGVSKEFDENGELFRRHYWVEGEMLFPT